MDILFPAPPKLTFFNTGSKGGEKLRFRGHCTLNVGGTAEPAALGPPLGIPMLSSAAQTQKAAFDIQRVDCATSPTRCCLWLEENGSLR